MQTGLPARVGLLERGIPPLLTGLLAKTLGLGNQDHGCVRLWNGEDDEDEADAREDGEDPKYPTPILSRFSRKSNAKIIRALTVPDTWMKPATIGPIDGPANGARENKLMA